MCGTHWKETILSRAQEVKDSLLDEPWLGDLGDDIVHQDLDNDLPNDESLRFRIIILLWKAYFQDKVNDLTIVLWVDCAIRRDRHVRLALREEVRKGRCSSCRV